MSWTAMLHQEGSFQSELTEQGLELTWVHCPEHARSAALVLSLTTGMVSPQFHVTIGSVRELVFSPKCFSLFLYDIQTV